MRNSVILRDHDGNPLRADTLKQQGVAPSTANPAITPVLGGSFDAYFDQVLVHFAYPYQWLDRGKNWYFGNARLAMQTDGNLVLYDQRNGSARWASNTKGSGTTQMLFQPDDNLVLYTAGYAKATWASNTYHNCLSPDWVPLLGLQSDSNFVIYCSWIDPNDYLHLVPVWSTNTVF